MKIANDLGIRFSLRRVKRRPRTYWSRASSALRIARARQRAVDGLRERIAAIENTRVGLQDNNYSLECTQSYPHWQRLVMENNAKLISLREQLELWQDQLNALRAKRRAIPSVFKGLAKAEALVRKGRAIVISLLKIPRTILESKW